MKISDELKDDVLIISLEGKVMGGPDATMFHGKLHEYANSGKKNVIVNLAKVEWMSSVGELKLANVTQGIESLLTITRLVTIFKTYDSIDEAIAAFGEK